MGFLEISTGDLQSHILIDKGLDSSVYRNNNEVIKVYDRPQDMVLLGINILSIKQILFYREITNNAASLDFGGLDLAFNIPIVVNPINEVGMFSEWAASVSYYIGGKTLSDIMRYDRSIGPFQVTPQTKEAIISNINVLSKHLDYELGVSGICLLPINVKYTCDKFVITDLCAKISLLARRGEQIIND